MKNKQFIKISEQVVVVAVSILIVYNVKMGIIEIVIVI
jgi:hypothetical protein